jgi:hypothetical protein
MEVERLFGIIERGIFEEVAHDELLVVATQVAEEDGASAHEDADLEDVTVYPVLRLPGVNNVEDADISEVQPPGNFVDPLQVGSKRRARDGQLSLNARPCDRTQ